MKIDIKENNGTIIVIINDKEIELLWRSSNLSIFNDYKSFNIAGEIARTLALLFENHFKSVSIYLTDLDVTYMREQIELLIQNKI